MDPPVWKLRGRWSQILSIKLSKELSGDLLLFLAPHLCHCVSYLFMHFILCNRCLNSMLNWVKRLLSTQQKADFKPEDIKADESSIAANSTVVCSIVLHTYKHTYRRIYKINQMDKAWNKDQKLVNHSHYWFPQWKCTSQFVLDSSQPFKMVKLVNPAVISTSGWCIHYVECWFKVWPGMRKPSKCTYSCFS